MLDAREPNDDCDLELFASRLKLGYQVFDSAPSYMDAKSSFNVIKELIPNPLVGIPAAGLFTLLARIVPNAVAALTSKPTLGDLFWNDLLKDESCNRQAFIYSDADDLVDAKRVKEFIEERKERGVCVMEKRFQDSGHVQHIRQHEEEYSDFVEAVLVGMKESNTHSK